MPNNSTATFDDFKCDNCGACCKVLLVEATWLDAMREPRLYELEHSPKKLTKEQCIVLYDVDKKACPFLDDCNKCGIYPTRPNECVAVEPGDAKCQQARLMSELPLLKDCNGNDPSEELLRASCEDYDLEFEEFFAQVEQTYHAE